MIPAAFDYRKPQTLEEAVRFLSEAGEDAKVLAGGHSLLPAMKLRLAQPKVLVDIGRIRDLSYIRAENGRCVIGAMTTHHAIESSEVLLKKCPLLPEVARQIGDVQVRNRGTLGGSLAHADPAADWPAAILALDAELKIVGPNGSRTIPAAEFFVDLFQSALQPNEILQEISFPVTGRSVAYVKFAQRASGFAIAGVAAVINAKAKSVGIGITGVGAKAYRASAVEKELNGKAIKSANLQAASAHATDGIEALNDIHASAEYRLHLARVNTRRALELALSRA